MLFNREEIRDLFLVFLARAKRRYRFRIANFCVMGNHIHLQVQPALGECLSSIMQWLLGCFARAYNKMHGWTGHFWGDRFHSRILAGMRQFAIAFGYIDENPVKAGLAARAADWRHGGAWHSRMGDGSILGEDPVWLRLLRALRPLLEIMPDTVRPQVAEGAQR